MLQCIRLPVFQRRFIFWLSSQWKCWINMTQNMYRQIVKCTCTFRAISLVITCNNFTQLNSVHRWWCQWCQLLTQRSTSICCPAMHSGVYTGLIHISALINFLLFQNNRSLLSIYFTTMILLVFLYLHLWKVLSKHNKWSLWLSRKVTIHLHTKAL